MNSCGGFCFVIVGERDLGEEVVVVVVSLPGTLGASVEEEDAVGVIGVPWLALSFFSFWTLIMCMVASATRDLSIGAPFFSGVRPGGFFSSMIFHQASLAGRLLLAQRISRTVFRLKTARSSRS